MAVYNTATMVFSSHSPVGHPRASFVLGGFDCQYQNIDRAGHFVGIDAYRTGYHDPIVAVGSQFDAVARSVATYQYQMLGRMQKCGDRRSGSVGTDQSDFGCGVGGGMVEITPLSRLGSR